MHVDWLTVAAQLVNFLILVYLLRRFLYAPVLAAMDRRQARIAQEVSRAARREQAAAEAGDELTRRLQALDQEHDQRLQALQREVHAQRAALLEALREEVARTRESWHDTVQRERQRFVSELSAQSAELTMELARRVVADLADARLEAQAVTRFIDALQELEPERRALLRTAKDRVVVHTGFSLQASDRARIEAALSAVLEDERPIEFARSRELICGVELVAGHARVGWSASGHLQRLESRVQDILARQLPAVATPER